MHKFSLLALVAVFALIGAGCGGGSSVQDLSDDNNEPTEANAAATDDSEAALNNPYIDKAAAVSVVKNSKTLARIASSYPQLPDNATIYVSPAVSRLGDNDLGVMINSTTEVFYRKNIDKKVWKVVVTCNSDTCDNAQYLLTLNENSPALPTEGIQITNDQLMFVINAETGEIVMYERGADVISQGEWEEFNG